MQKDIQESKGVGSGRALKTAATAPDGWYNWKQGDMNNSRSIISLGIWFQAAGSALYVAEKMEISRQARSTS